MFEGTQHYDAHFSALKIQEIDEGFDEFYQPFFLFVNELSK
jgi:hypothetical protein